MNKRKLRKFIKTPKLFFFEGMLNKRGGRKQIPTTASITPVSVPYRYTIICPTYNTEQWIDDFFESVKNQSLSFEKHIHVFL